MSTNLKALVVVLFLSFVTFRLARRFCLEFTEAADYDRRMKLWLLLTTVAFLSPSFWLWFFVAAPLMYWCAARDTSPPSVYLLLMHVIPPVSFFIPVAGINQLFDLNNYRIAAVAILLPFLLRQPRDSGSRLPVATLALACVVGFGLLRLALNFPYESVTNTMRRGFLFLLDVFLLYYAFSRAAKDASGFRTILCAFCLSCALMAPIALFEALRGWLMYEGIPSQWGNPLPFMYLTRGDSLRAQVSAGHSLPLGYMMAIALGAALYLSNFFAERRDRIAIVGWFLVGLYGPMSRAPWLTAVILVAVYFALQPKGFKRIAKGGLAFVMVAGLLLLTPLGDRIINFLPFVGKVDAENVDYRQQLAELSWELVQVNPWFGDPFVMANMEELRQGQGIIDLVNVYAEIALFNGLVGLFLFITPFLMGIWVCIARAKQEGPLGNTHALLGLYVAAAMIATLFMMATGSLGTGLAQMFWILGGLSMTYACLSEQAVDSPMEWRLDHGVPLRGKAGAQ